MTDNHASKEPLCNEAPAAESKGFANGFNQRLDSFVEKLRTFVPEPRGTTTSDCPVDRILERLFSVVKELCQGLEKREWPAVRVYAHNLALLIRFMDNLVKFEGDPDYLRAFLRQQMLLHPDRRPPHGALALIIGESSEESLTSIFATVKTKYLRWGASALVPANPDRIMKDPELLPREVFAKSLTHVSSKPVDMIEACPICDLPFQFPDQVELAWNPRSAIRTLCNHHFCNECLVSWRLQAIGGAYTCPMCRCCLVCGKQTCRIHVVPEELARPMPLLDVVNGLQEFKGLGDSLLERFGVGRVWTLREDTRQPRVILAFCGKKARDETLSEEQRRGYKQIGSAGLEEVIKILRQHWDETRTRQASSN